MEAHSFAAPQKITNPIRRTTASLILSRWPLGKGPMGQAGYPAAPIVERALDAVHKEEVFLASAQEKTGIRCGWYRSGGESRRLGADHTLAP